MFEASPKAPDLELLLQYLKGTDSHCLRLLTLAVLYCCTGYMLDILQVYPEHAAA